MPSRDDILANITTGPGRPSRGDILAGMTGGAQGPLVDLVKGSKAGPQRTPITTAELFPRAAPVALPPAPEPEPGPFEFAGPLGKFIDLIDTPRAAIVSTIKETGDLFRGEGFSPTDWWKQTGDNLFMQDVMRDWGVDLPGPLDMVVGLGFDIAFDPITYATGGIGAAGRAGMTAPRLIKTMSRGAAYYDDIAKAGGKAGVTLTQAQHKAGVLKKAVLDVGKSNAMNAASREALQEVGLLGQMGLFVPATGRLGRGLRLDKVLDKATRGGVMARRARQASRLPYIDDLARPVAGRTLDDATEAVARFGREGLEDAAAAEAKILERMKMIAGREALPDIADDFYTAAARMAARMPVEAVRLPGFTGKVLSSTVPQFGKAKANLMGRKPVEMIDTAFNTRSSIKEGLRSGDYETVLGANKAMTSNSAGWAARNRFMDVMSKSALQMRRRARKLGMSEDVVDDLWKTELWDYAPGSKAPRVGVDGLPVMNPMFRQKFGVYMEQAGEAAITDFWGQGRKWMDDALINANILGGSNWLSASADELWVMRLALESATDPTAARTLIPGAEFRGVPLLSQVDDPLKRTVEEQIRAIANSELGDGAEELFDRNIWRAMDRYLSKIGEGVRRAKVMNLLEEQGVVFKEPLAWIKGQVDEGYDALRGLYGNRGDAFNQVFRAIEQGFDAEQVKAMRMAAAARDGASKMGEQTAAWVAEVELLESRLVEIQARLVDKMTDVAGQARRSSDALGEFMKPLLQEASVLGYRYAQLQAISRALTMQRKAMTPTITDQKLLDDLTVGFGNVQAALKAVMEEAKSVAKMDKTVAGIKDMIEALQVPLKKLDKQGLLDGVEPGMRDWISKALDIRENIAELGVEYLDLSGISLEKLPRWFGEVQNSWQDVSAAYQGAVDRGYGQTTAMNEWRRRQALAGGILLGEESPFVRLEATLRDGVWSRRVSGGAMVSEGEPLKWSAAPLEAPSLTARSGERAPKYSIPSEKELLTKYRSVTNVDEATHMTLQERQALRLREAKEWTDAGKHVTKKPGKRFGRGQTAMSAREVGGRRQIDTWHIEPTTGDHRFGEGLWSISVNGEEVAVGRTLKEAKLVAQAEATKRGGLAPTAREVATEAVTPRIDVEGARAFLEWSRQNPRPTGLVGEPVDPATMPEAARRWVDEQTAGWWKDDINEPIRDEWVDEATAQVNVGGDESLLDVERTAVGRERFTEQVVEIETDRLGQQLERSADEVAAARALEEARDAAVVGDPAWGGFPVEEAVTPPPAAAAAEVVTPPPGVVTAHENDRVREVKGWVQAYERTLPESKTWNQVRHDVAGDVESFLAGTHHGWLPTPGKTAAGRKVGEYGRLGASEEEVLVFVEARYPLGKGVGPQGDHGAPLHWPVKKPWDAEAQRKYAKKLRQYVRDMFVSNTQSGVARMAGEAEAEAASAVAARRAVARRKVFSACTEGKCELAEGATVAAEDLYTGGPFKFMRRRIDASDAELGGIISAKHGVLDPAELVETYDVQLPRLPNSKKVDRTAAKEIVAGPEQLRKFADLVGDAEELYFDGGVEYRILMRHLLKRAQERNLVGRHVRVVEPTGTAAGGGPRGIGEIKGSLGKWAGEGSAAPRILEIPAAAAKRLEELGQRLRELDETYIPVGGQGDALSAERWAAIAEWEELTGGQGGWWDEVNAQHDAARAAAEGPVWRGLGGYKKGDAYELGEGAFLQTFMPPGSTRESDMVAFRIRRSKGKAGGWTVWYKRKGRMEKFERVAGGGNVRVPAKSNPDKTVMVPGVWKTLEDAKASVADELVEAVTPAAREVAAEAVTPPPATATSRYNEWLEGTAEAVTPPPAAGAIHPDFVDEAARIETMVADEQVKAGEAAWAAGDRVYVAGPKGGPVFDEVIVRTPFGDFQLRFIGKKKGRRVQVVKAPAALKDAPAKTGPKKGGTRVPLGDGVEFQDYDTARETIGRWAEEVYETRWSGKGIVEKGGEAEVAQGAVGRLLQDPARQGGVRQALASLTGRTETTGFYGVKGLSWIDEPLWRMPLDQKMAFTEVERRLLTDAERLNHLAYAEEHYRNAESAMQQGLEAEAQIAVMQGRLRQLQAEKAVMKEAGAKEGAMVPELYDGRRTDLDLFQEDLRKFNAVRTRDLFGEALTEQTAAQWGPNTAQAGWSQGWSAPLQGEEAAPMFEMLNALFKTSSTVGDFEGFLKWYDKFLNYWKAQAVSTPGFVLRNGLGGSWLSYAFGLMELGSTNKFAGTYFRAIRGGKGDAVAGIDDMIAKLLGSGKKTVGVGFGSRVDVNELRTIRRVLDSGIVGGGQVITEVDRSVAMRLVKESRNPITGNPIDVVFNPASTEFAPFRFIRSTNEQMETVLRGALAFDVMQKGGSVGEAAGQVYKFHFNYADLTATERKARRIIPFWTWQKNVVPILVESLGKNPVAWGRLQQVKGNMELQSKEEGVVPDYFLENMAIRLPWKINEYQSYWIPDLPFRDLNRLMKEPGSITRVFAESAAPPVKVPLEIWAGKQFFADLPFSGRYQQVPHVYDKFPFLMQALALAGKAKKDRKGEYKMRDQDLYMLDSWMPFLSRFRRLLPNESRYSRRVVSTVVSTVFGTQVRINDPHETRNQMLRDDRAFDEKMRDLIDIEMRVR